MSSLLTQIGRAGANPEKLAAEVLSDPHLVTELMSGLGADTARVKFGCAKVLRLVSERQPEVLYPQFDSFAGLLGHPNKILQWEAIFVLSHLARVDTRRKFDAIFDRYFASITGPVMITAANTIVGGARIALARPEWADRIAAEILKVARARYQTAECRNVAIGHAIQALSQFQALLRQPQAVLRFVRRQLKNTRPAVRKKAARFLANGASK